MDWYFMTILIFWTISVITLAAANFKRSSEVDFYKEIYVQGGLNLEKIHRSVRVYEILNFSKKVRFRSKFREIQALSQIVLHNRK